MLVEGIKSSITVGLCVFVWHVQLHLLVVNVARVSLVSPPASLCCLFPEWLAGAYSDHDFTPWFGGVIS